MKFGNIISTIESLENTEQTPVEVAENETALVDGVTETEELGNQVDAQITAVDTADESVDSLDEASSVIASGEGDLSSAEVLTTETLLSSINQSLGLDKTVATTECYKGMSRSQLVATLEDKKEGILSKIGAVIVGIFNTIIGFIGSLLRNKTLLGKYIDGLQKRVDNYKEDSDKKEVSAKFEDSKQALDALAESERLVDLTQKISDKSKNLVDSLHKFLNSKPSETDGVEELALSAIKEIVPSDNEIDKNIIHSGGKTISLVFGEKEGSEEVGIRIPQLAEGKDIAKGTRLTKDECKSVLAAAKKTLESLNKLSGIEGRFKTFIKVINDGIRGFGSSIKHRLTSDEGKKRETIVAAFLRVIMAGIRGITFRYTSVLPRVAFNDIKAAADYVKASL